MKLGFTPLKATIANFPNPEINPELQRLIKVNANSKVLGDANRTDFSFGLEIRDKSSELDYLLSWIESAIPQMAHIFACGKVKEYCADEIGYSATGFKLREVWGVNYKKDQGVYFHNHFPYCMSFVYYVNVPEGAAPLILDDQEMRMETGQVCFFLGHLFHAVPTSPVEGRCVITGNISYDFYESYTKYRGDNKYSTHNTDILTSM